MSYNVDELFGFEEYHGAIIVNKYLKGNDPSVTELEIPAEYNGKPVVIIGIYAFSRSDFIKRAVIPPSVRIISYGAFCECSALESVELCEGLEIIQNFVFAETRLKSIILPKSLKEIRKGAFMSCPELERVEFNSAPRIGSNVFGGCPKLPPETVVMGLVCSTDLTRPLFREYPERKALRCDLFRPDVFELLAKNDCFRGRDLKSLFYEIIDENKPELLSLAEQYKMLVNARLIDKLIEHSAEHKKVECTAFLLELKNRKFKLGGMNGLEIYDVDELFEFTKNSDKRLGGYAVKYYKKRDKNVAEVEIPAEYNGEPVTAIASFGFSEAKYLKRVVIPPSVRYIEGVAFAECQSLETVELSEGLEIIHEQAFSGTKLKSIVLPKSLKQLDSFVFTSCLELETVTLNSKPSLGLLVFDDCPKLPADFIIMDLVHSCDISEPFNAEDYNHAFKYKREKRLEYIRPDVLELAIKNDCFRSVDKFVMLKFIIEEENAKSLRAAGENGLFDKPELIDRCIEYSAEQGKTELTAYLLDLKNRKFGFNGGNDIEL